MKSHFKIILFTALVFIISTSVVILFYSKVDSEKELRLLQEKYMLEMKQKELESAPLEECLDVINEKEKTESKYVWDLYYEKQSQDYYSKCEAETLSFYKTSTRLREKEGLPPTQPPDINASCFIMSSDSRDSWLNDIKIEYSEKREECYKKYK